MTQPRNALEATENVVATPTLHVKDIWRLYVDSSSNYLSLRTCLVFTTSDDYMLKQAIILSFKVSNSEAEYETLLAGLQLVKNLAVKKLAIYFDS